MELRLGHRTLTSAANSGGLLTRSVLFVIAFAIALVVGCNRSETTKKPDENVQATQPANDAEVISALVSSEETYLVLSQKAQALSRGLLNLRLPGIGAESIFAPSVKVTDLGPASGVGSRIATDMEAHAWPVSSLSADVSKVDLWRPLLDGVAWLDHATLELADGGYPQGDRYRYESKARFDGLARMKSGEWRSLRGNIGLSWQRSRGATNQAPSDWQITRWTTESLEYIASTNKLFVEALESAVPNPQAIANLRRSRHYEATVKYYQGGMTNLPHPYFAPISANQKEGIAVADIDGDGFDDIYITVRIGTNMLLRNRGDGTFVEAAADHGLALPGHTMCSLFADFDNDGDLDAILGRSLLRSTYLENRGGKFFQYPIPPFMPMAVISMAAADFNKDGLLDIYFCTYRPAAPAGASPAGGSYQGKEGDFDWPDEFLSPDMAREFRRRLAENLRQKNGTVLDQVGPPNVLLINKGDGQFEPAPISNPAVLWRNSLQATWGDYDEDGDPDLFVANDWAPSNLFRNDGAGGFTDVSELAGATSYGFSMGASWGDYDNDGLDDLYVSNMYSEPGRRMTARIGGLSQMFVESASGNWLYRQTSRGKFQQVSGMEPPKMTVMDAGWSWGGCFADFDNDGFLDLYVLSGYFTAPKELSSDLDLESNLWRTMLRTDENLSRPSFRFSPEWKRTSAPDNLGPQIDARLAGVERHSDRIMVHSLNGDERNHYFANRNGRSFADISALSGLDNPADSRGFAVLDYDRDGWQDVALVNANEPLFNLYHNEMGAAGRSNGIIAIRFVGGNRGGTPSTEFSCRDGFGARVTVELGDQKLVRENRCGDGWSTQNSATMIVGIGSHKTAASVTVRFPRGRTIVARNVAEGTLLTAFENPADAPANEPFTRSTYRVASKPRPRLQSNRPMFPLASADARATSNATLRVYTTFSTGSADCIKALPHQVALRDTLGPERIDFVAIPVDEQDDNAKLAAYNREHRPPARLLNVPANRRKDALAAYASSLGLSDAPIPSTVVTDASGRRLSAMKGIPTISELRRLNAEAGGN